MDKNLLISTEEIQELYKKVGLNPDDKFRMRLSINTGTLSNKLFTAKQSSLKVPYSLNHVVRKKS